METLKQLFGFMMFGAAIWLLWVLANQVDANSLLLVLIGWFLAALIGAAINEVYKTLMIAFVLVVLIIYLF